MPSTESDTVYLQFGAKVYGIEIMNIMISFPAYLDLRNATYSNMVIEYKHRGMILLSCLGKASTLHLADKQ